MVGYFANAQYDVKAQVGYFACAQYDVLFLHVILNAVKNPTEELTSIYFITSVVGYFACAQYDVKGGSFVDALCRVSFFC